jgi:alanyl-tRNA synthetase
MKSQDVRRSFVDYFVALGHRHLPSASLVPGELSTTLFTIAGMEQFVPVFLGSETSPSPRVVTVQRCLRVAGGKNDIENVGRSGRHGTLLEMLGNFSFGDYYKREAIAWAWDYLTRVLHLPPDRLHATVYVDDDEAARIWADEIGLSPERVTRLREDNFWDMGPTGPCGPCSEIYYDLGRHAGCGKTTCGVGCPDCDRYLEFWNLVFQQYDRDAGGRLHPLPKPCIDTGMGLERLCMILAGKTSIFDTDLYEDIIAGLPADGSSALDVEERRVHRRIIADHARAATFLVADGVMPSNTDRGYVLRFLTRRAIRSGKLLGFPDGFFSRAVPHVVASLADGYPELREKSERVARVLETEERQFEATLVRGSARLAAMIEPLKAAGSKAMLKGSAIFELHDTFGFPPELTSEIARDAGIGVDMAGYREAMEDQRERARRDAAGKRAEIRVDLDAADSDASKTEFVGYDVLEASGTIVRMTDATGKTVHVLGSGAEGGIELDRTPFYAERGGQAGDRGAIAAGASAFDVADTRYADKNHRRIVHFGRVQAGELRSGMKVDAIVDPWWRREIRRHHTVTHLLQRALKEVAGDSVAQRGSAVFADRTRFDFDSPVGALNKEQRGQVAGRVNELIRADYHVGVDVMPFAAAIERGVVYMKGEQYGDMVRVVTFGPSVELCGGTHVESTGEIGHFVLLHESAIGAGIRRVEGLVSESADAYVTRLRDATEEVGSILTATVEQLPDSVARLARERRELEKKIAALSSQLAASRVEEFLADAREIDGVPYLAVRADGDGVSMKDLADSIRSKWKKGVLVVAHAADGKVSLLVTASQDVADRGASARAILQKIAPYIDGKGGGSDTAAQGGGKNAAGIDAAFAGVPEAIKAVLRG